MSLSRDGLTRISMNGDGLAGMNTYIINKGNEMSPWTESIKKKRLKG
jgi:hypothetical protein